MTTLYERGGDRHILGANDLIFDRFGDIWFIVMADGSVYFAKADGSETKLVTNNDPRANGIALSPDESILSVVWGMNVRACPKVQFFIQCIFKNARRRQFPFCFKKNLQNRT